MVKQQNTSKPGKRLEVVFLNSRQAERLMISHELECLMMFPDQADGAVATWGTGAPLVPQLGNVVRSVETRNRKHGLQGLTTAFELFWATILTDTPRPLRTSPSLTLWLSSQNEKKKQWRKLSFHSLCTSPQGPCGSFLSHHVLDQVSRYEMYI